MLISNIKREFSTLKSAIDDMLALDFANAVKDLRVDLYASKQELANVIDNTNTELSNKFTDDIYGKYELLISKIDYVEDELKITVKTAEKVEKIFSDAGLDVNLKKVIERMEEEGISLTKASNELVKEKLEEIEAEWEYQREYALCLSCTKFKRCVMSPKDECAAYWPK